MDEADLKVAIIGMGHVGCPMAAVIAERGHTVVGIDASKETVDALNAGKTRIYEPGLDDLIAQVVRAGKFTAASDFSAVSGCDLILVTVGTPLSPEGTADLSAIVTASEALAPHLSDGQTVVLKSTVPPGTTEGVVAPVLGKNAKISLAFCPERLAEGAALRELRVIPIVVGGVTAEDASRAEVLLTKAIGVPCERVDGTTAAELVKLADNLWIDLNIALANELAKVADSLGVDVLQVIRAANTLPKGTGNVNILIPSMGVGGSCLTKDPWFIQRFAADRNVQIQLPGQGRQVNDSMPRYSVDRIATALAVARPGMDKSDIKVCILGIAFKSDTSDCRHTPTAPAIQALKDMGYHVVLHDPYVTEDGRQSVTDLPLEPSLEVALSDADCIAFFTGHKPYRDLTPEGLARAAKRGAVVFDGRMFYPTDFVSALKAHGLSYVGVGRG